MPAILHSVMLGALGIVPSLVWLWYYLRKDCHPEPKSLVAKVFLMGIILSPLAIVFQLLFVELAKSYSPSIGNQSASFFLWAALVEELVKYYAVRMIALYDPAFDEPVDAMIYMITAALGFAAMENILVVFQVIPNGTHAVVSVLTLRFVGATLLHTLSSAIVGYFVALSWFFRHHERKLVFIGLSIATLFHFTFNVLLSSVQDQLASLLYVTGLLTIMAFLVSLLFDKIKERHAKNVTTPISL